MNKMRRTDREITREDALEILVKGEYGILSTIGQDGYPYAVPVNYAVEGDCIYIHGTNGVSQRNENMQGNPHVCFTVIGETEVLPSQFGTKYESAVVMGTARLSVNPEKGLMKLVDKYSSEFKESGMKHIEAAIQKTSVYEISIESITGKARR